RGGGGGGRTGEAGVGGGVRERGGAGSLVGRRGEGAGAGGGDAGGRGLVVAGQRVGLNHRLVAAGTARAGEDGKDEHDGRRGGEAGAEAESEQVSAHGYSSLSPIWLRPYYERSACAVLGTSGRIRDERRSVQPM